MEDVRMKSLEESDEFFCGMVDLIHPDHYGFAEDVRNQLKEARQEMVNKKLNKGERLRLKEHGKQLLSRLDMDGCHTVTEIWSWLADQKPSNSLNSKATGGSSPFLSDGTLVDKNKKGSKKRTKSQVNGSPLIPRTDMLVKLQSKVESMRKSRKADLQTKKSVLSKDKRKNNRKTTSNNNKPIPIENGGASTKNETTTSSSNDDSKPIIKNINGETVYSKFDFSVFGVKSNDKKKSKTNKTLTGRNYKKILETVEKREEKLVKMKLDQPDKASELEKKLHWDAAIDRAQGIKVKDDKNLLKQSLKRKEKIKKSSLKKWKHRDEKLQDKVQKRQDDRNRNLQKRKSDNKQRKLDKARKKGRLVPSKI